MVDRREKGTLLAHVEKSAVLSDDGLYRYELTRTWEDWDGPRLCWVMLNPSTADAEVDDPTIRRCMAFSKAWGYHSLVVVNLFGLRATDPKVLVTPPCNPVGPDNDLHIEMAVLGSSDVIAAWGTKGVIRERNHAVTRLLTVKMREDVNCLAVTKDGHPKHPLYVKGDTMPSLYRPAEVQVSGRPDRCPTCDGDGPDRVDEDYTSGGMEMECGDDWHDGVSHLGSPFAGEVDR